MLKKQAVSGRKHEYVSRCTAAHPEVCPKDYHLAKLTGFGIWAEGVEGQFAIDLKSISAGP